MFGMSMPEILLILAVALIVFGPKKLPELAKSLGRALHEFKKATNDFKETMEENTGIKEVKKAITDANIKDIIDISSETSDKQPLASKSSEVSDTLKAKIPDNTENLEKKTEKAKIPDNTENLEKKTELKQKTEKGIEKDDK